MASEVQHCDDCDDLRAEVERLRASRDLLRRGLLRRHLHALEARHYDAFMLATMDDNEESAAMHNEKGAALEGKINRLLRGES